MDESVGGIVERFFEHLTARDWPALGEVLASDVERVGPFGDVVVGRDRYLDLLAGVVPADYGNDVLRIASARDGRSAFARVREHLRYPTMELHLEEAYTFDIDDRGLISRVEVFGQTPEADPGGFGSARSEDSYASAHSPTEGEAGL